MLGERISVWLTSLGLGDTVCATPTVRRIRQIHPAARLSVYSYYPDIFKHNPHVDEVHFFEESKELDGIYDDLRRKNRCRWFRTFFSATHKPPPITQPQGGAMQPTTINPDIVCQQAIQAKLNVYQGKEQFGTVLKQYNDQVDNLINLVNLMKSPILELEGQMERARAKSATAPKEAIADA